MPKIRHYNAKLYTLTVIGHIHGQISTSLQRTINWEGTPSNMRGLVTHIETIKHTNTNIYIIITIPAIEIHK